MQKIKGKQVLYLVIDAISVNIAFFLAYFFRFSATVFREIDYKYLIGMLIATPCFLVFFIIFRVYNTIWIHADFSDVFNGVMANVLAGFIVLAIQAVRRDLFLPLVILGTIVSVILILGTRLTYILLIQTLSVIKNQAKGSARVMIIGAGDAGIIALNEMRKSKDTKLYPVCFIDDDKNSIGTYISGIRVTGDSGSIIAQSKEKAIDVILIAIPSLTEERRKEILDICSNTGCVIKTMPALYDIISGRASTRTIRNVQPEDLLRHESFETDDAAISEKYIDKVILITGGAGVIGSNICKLLLKYLPKQIIVMDINENRLDVLQKEIDINFPGSHVKSVLCSIKDANGINSIFKNYSPQIVIHCASHNNLSFLTESPAEAIKSNVFGTYYLVRTSDENKVEQFLFLSTNKANNPVDIIGASKRIGEMLIQSMNKKSDTKFCAIRFGNVFDNTYSSVSRFRSQLEKGGPLTVENKELTRYFMTIPEVCNLILETGVISQGGEIFILDMGNPVRIYDLAKDYIRLSGFIPDKDIEIHITGEPVDGDIREESLVDSEGINKTKHERIYQTRSVFDNLPELKSKIETLALVLEKGNNELIADYVIQTVKDLVPNFYYLTFNETLFADSEKYRQSLLDGKKKIFLASPHMGGLEELYIKEAFESNWVSPLGPNVDEFENEIQRFVDIGYAAAMTTGTAAVHMALRSLGVDKGDYVFCSSLTFAGSCNPIIYQSAIPIFIDSDYESWNMSPKALKKALEEYSERGKLPKAIIVVDLYGQCADYDSITELCNQYDIPIIEDAAESLGATYRGRMSGTLGKFGVFSFNGNKIITTSGGGMIVSDDELAIKKVKFSITQARDQARHYQHSELGFNYRMSNVLAGIGRGQLKVIKKRLEQKKHIYEYYRKAFIDISDIEMMPIMDYGTPNYWLTVITLNEQSKVKQIDILLALENELIESRPLWKPMHLQPYFMKYDFISHNDEGISVSEDLFNRGICLPSDTKLSDSDLMRITNIVRECWS